VGDTIRIQEWDGAAEMDFTASEEQNIQWSKTGPAYEGYLQNVIVPDERRFLVSEALEHTKVVDPGTVEGQKEVIIQDGRILITRYSARDMG
jgi:hypothetical protein